MDRVLLLLVFSLFVEFKSNSFLYGFFEGNDFVLFWINLKTKIFIKDFEYNIIFQIYEYIKNNWE